jgi:cell division protein FtsB
MNADTSAERDPAQPPSRRVRWEHPTRIAVASLSFIAIMFLFVFPTRSYLAQQRQVRAARRAVAVLQQQNKELSQEQRLLETKSEIERLARVQFDMIFPGEQAYNIVPLEKAAAHTPPPR